MVLLTSGWGLTNPLPVPAVTEYSVSPPWIEAFSFSIEQGDTIRTMSGYAVVGSITPGPYDLVVLDSSNTTGFTLNPEGDSIIMSGGPVWDYFGYGTMGNTGVPPLPGESADAYIVQLNEWNYDLVYVFCAEPDTGDWNFDVLAAGWGSLGVTINEINLHSTWPDNSNFIELYNATSDTVEIGGMWLIGNDRYQIPTSNIILPYGYFVIDGIDLPPGFNLNYNIDNLYLAGGDFPVCSLNDQVGWSSDHGENVSFMRYPDGDVDTTDNYSGYRGYDDQTSYTFENGFPSRGAPNRHDSPGFVVIGAHALVLDIGIDVGWTNPVWDPMFDEVRIVRNVEHYPETVDDGDTVYEGDAQEFLDIGAPMNSPIHYTIFAKDTNGQYSTPTEESRVYVINGVVGIDDDPLPVKISYLKAYPNPFNNKTMINFSLTEPALVNLSVYNLLGQQIDVLANEQMRSGENEIAWDASGYSSGIYLATLATPDEVKSIKVELLK
jgi:hypothetical protein